MWIKDSLRQTLCCISVQHLWTTSNLSIFFANITKNIIFNYYPHTMSGKVFEKKQWHIFRITLQKFFVTAGALQFLSYLFSWVILSEALSHPTHQNTEIMSQATFKCCTRVFTHKNRIHKLNIERLGYTYKCKSCSHQFFTLIKIHINNPIYFCFTKNPLRVHKWLMAVVSGTPLVHSMLPLPNSSEGRQVLP